MRFRLKPQFTDLLWILLALLQIIGPIDHLYHHLTSHPLNAADIFILANSGLLLLVWLAKMFFSTCEVTATSLFLQSQFHKKRIDYNNIVAIRPKPDSKSPDVLEIETALISPDIYPHQYMVIAPYDRTAFLAALRPHLRPELFETV